MANYSILECYRGVESSKRCLCHRLHMMDQKVKESVVTLNDILRGGVHGATDEMCYETLDHVREHLNALNLEVRTQLNNLRKCMKDLDDFWKNKFVSDQKKAAKERDKHVHNSVQISSLRSQLYEKAKVINDMNIQITQLHLELKNKDDQLKLLVEPVDDSVFDDDWNDVDDVPSTNVQVKVEPNNSSHTNNVVDEAVFQNTACDIEFANKENAQDFSSGNSVGQKAGNSHIPDTAVAVCSERQVCQSENASKQCSQPYVLMTPTTEQCTMIDEFEDDDINDEDILQAEIQCLEQNYNGNITSTGNAEGVALSTAHCVEVSQHSIDNKVVSHEDVESDNVHNSVSQQVMFDTQCENEFINDELCEADILEGLMQSDSTDNSDYESDCTPRKDNCKKIDQNKCDTQCERNIFEALASDEMA